MSPGSVWVAVDSRQSESTRGSLEALVKREDRRIGVLGGEEHAAGRELEPGLRPEPREPRRPIGPQRDLPNRETTERTDRRFQAACPSRPHEHLGEREWAGAELTPGDDVEHLSRPRVLAVVLIEMGDEDAGVENDHSGQSSRRSAV